mmetsp:Transcript_9296/g.56589  ORF Transcript_9296/g.56589 Transcript_9296/m.56589 type:complete len:141 (+) Transcript_9296:3773-4195(+)
MRQHPIGPLCADLSSLESCVVFGACNFESSCSIAKNSAGLAWTNPLHWPKESEEDLPTLPCGHFGLDTGDVALRMGFQCSLAAVTSLLREKVHVARFGDNSHRNILHHTQRQLHEYDTECSTFTVVSFDLNLKNCPYALH